jgi:hypothetical protein
LMDISIFKIFNLLIFQLHSNPSYILPKQFL